MMIPTGLNIESSKSSHEQNVTLSCVIVVSCKKLTTLHYSGYPFPSSKGLTDLSSHIPFLENLFLDLPDGCNSLKLSSHSLKTFVLCSECELEDIDINAPNLLLFEYRGYLRMFGSMVTNTVPLKACMIFDSSYNVDTLLFKNLRRFLDKKIKFKELKLEICDHIDDFEELKLIQSAPYELEHVELARFTSEKLLQQENEGKINIRIEMCWSSKAKKQFSDINSLLAALPDDQPGETVTFIKEGVDWREHPDPGCLLAPAIVQPTRNSSSNSFGLQEHHLE
ncbi:hypothetical protein Tco_1427710 [Tanacetum coccineum]